MKNSMVSEHVVCDESACFEDVISETVVNQAVGDNFVEQSIVYSAMHVQRQLVRKTKCEKCLKELIRCAQELDVHQSVLRICKLSETELKIVINKKENVNVGKYYCLLENRILRNVSTYHSDMFDGLMEHILDQDALNNHRNLLIKLCIDFYLKLRLEQYAKNLGGIKTSLRKKLTKLILFRGE